MESAEDRKDALKLFDALNEFVETTREEAAAAGLDEGADDNDEEDEEDGEDQEEEEEEEIPDMGDDAADEYKQDLMGNEADVMADGENEEEDAEDIEEEDGEDDLPEIENPSGPRSVLKVNESLYESLGGPVNLRTSQFDSRRTLAFD